MGALVGGTFASGNEREGTSSTPCGRSPGRTPSARSGLRAKVPMRRKLAGNTYSNSLEFGWRDGRFAAPSGLISTRQTST